MTHTFVERDLHVLKYFSSVITVSGGKVVNVTEPTLKHCPLACHFYQEFKKADPADKGSLRGAVQKAIEFKIENYGFFTKNRSFHFPERAVPFGASEMLAASFKSRFLDATVVVCDGAGTVIVRSPEAVQGIGARMNTLILTSPIKEIQRKLKESGCHIVSEDTDWIDQVQGVAKAISLGYKKIGVTVAGFSARQLEMIRALEARENVAVTILVVCTTGISSASIEMIREHADLVWSCASGEVRERIGRDAILQLSKQIPVYALTPRGVAFTASCFGNALRMEGLDVKKQYLISEGSGSLAAHLGECRISVQEAVLPVASGRSPVFCSRKEGGVLV